MLTINEIKDYKEHLINTVHAARMSAQKNDREFYNDKFPVPLVKDQRYVTRSGRARKMIDNPLSHLVTDNPQVFRKPSKVKKGAVESALKVSSELNRWVQNLKTENPDPFAQHPKDNLINGEGWHYIVHDDTLPEQWQRKFPNAMPIRFFILDPLVVFADTYYPERNGTPARVVISYERTIASLRDRYPEWVKDKKDESKVPYFMYMDKDVRYVEIGKEKVFTNGIEPNIYGFVPFVHCYSGFGSRADDDDPAALAVGRLRYVKDLLREECTIRSDLNFVLHRYAHPSKTLFIVGEIPQDQIDKFNAAPYSFNVIQVPSMDSFRLETMEMTPPEECFRMLGDIEARLALVDPPIYSGIATGSSGRQEDIVQESLMKSFDSVINNSAKAWATALSIGLGICETIPDWIPAGLTRGDINGDYNCEVMLRATDPIATDRLRTLGDRKEQMGQISPIRNLMEYQGKTEEEARKIFAETMAFNVIKNSPEIAQAIGLTFIEEAGLREAMEKLQQKRALYATNPPLPASPQFGSQGGEPRVGNIQTQRGREEMDLSLMERGQRRSPYEG